VFEQETYQPIKYQITNEAFERIQEAGIATEKLKVLLHIQYPDASQFNDELSKIKELSRKDRKYIFSSAEINQVKIIDSGISAIPADEHWITEKQKSDLKRLEGRSFYHKWLLQNALVEISPYWQYMANDKGHNEKVRHQLSRIYKLFRYNNH